MNTAASCADWLHRKQFHHGELLDRPSTSLSMATTCIHDVCILWSYLERCRNRNTRHMSVKRAKSSAQGSDTGQTPFENYVITE